MPTVKNKPAKLKKLLTVANIQNQTVQRLQWMGKWLEAFGRPQDRGVWFVWGGSGSGKSTFVMMLAKAMAELQFKTYYNLLEEETDDTDYIDRTELLQMKEVESNFYTQSYNYKELMEYLKKRNPPKVVVVDSIVYLTKDWEDYLALKRLCIKKGIILIIVGHAEGKNPRSEFEKSIRFDAKMKIFVDGFLAVCQGRTIGSNGGRFIVYQKGYQMLQGDGAN